jgi:glycine hydroxymethyltransferase
MKNLQKTDKQMYKLFNQELQRQQNTLSLIPSENIISESIKETIGSHLSNKYAEGYPHKRYYQGMEFIDQIELLTTNRAKKLFNVEYANVQPYSGSIANLEAYLSIIKPNDKIMGLNLSSGGHLTHGNQVSFTGKLFKSISYDVDKTGNLNYKEIEKIALKEKPKLIIAGTTAYSKILDWKKFSQIAKKVNAYLIADISHIAGLIAAEVYPSPSNYADIITTTTHKTLRGPRGAIIMVTKKGIKKDPDLIKKIQQTVFPGIQGGPHINTIAGIGVALQEASSNKFKTYAKQVIKNTQILCQELKKYNFNIVNNETESHLILIDLQNKDMIGNLAAEALESVNIITNKNSIPFDPNPPFYPSGIRLGTPSITTRNIKQKQIKQIAKLINDTIEIIKQEKQNINFNDQKKKENRLKLISNCKKDLDKIKKQVLEICKQFPIK